MYHPYQRVRILYDEADPGENILLAASGPYLFSLNLNTRRISKWPKETAENPDIHRENQNDGEPPEKRRKTAPKASGLPNFIKIAVTNDRKHVIAVTAEDKCLRVLKLEDSGELRELSLRCMPKRPCAIAITPDDQTILCGDKFGDVYEIPLLQPPDDSQSSTPVPPTHSEDVPDANFVPQASDLTVHSRANRRALEAQRKQKAPLKTKEPLKFTHKLLLGHASILTDMLFTTIEAKVTDGSTQLRNYILTSDRDEHIRVSRGPPQAHVIENYCLGHKEFVNKITLLSPEVLVSGGGDDELFVWKWREGQLVRTISIHQTISKFAGESPDNTEELPESPAEEREAKIAVTGLWTVPRGTGPNKQVLVACEGVPKLIHLSAEALGDPCTTVELGVISTGGNVLDVTVLGRDIIVSVDTYHQAGSVDTARQDNAEEPIARLQAYRYSADAGRWERNAALDKRLQKCNGEVIEVVDEKSMRDVLYGVENLRKRPDEIAEEAGGMIASTGIRNPASRKGS
ncbi:hypothetical protein BDY21DRAFT_177335 [Lineolata rhizophorae]|uniref:Uncharacterized protein n=1 Tax=Lineolata rhizophorae TaxID=578093 RepID=A0A6A6P796_9PEZI|nr:hypothetical protein BDY21DRAFT_177335 [Lineolata rhizophorae]